MSFDKEEQLGKGHIKKASRPEHRNYGKISR
jgi:hypothetical protein